MTEATSLFAEAFLNGDLDAAFADLCAESKELGMPYVVYGCMNREITLDSGEPLVKLHYPKAWLKRYSEMNYLQIDPIVRMPLVSDKPFIWSRIRNMTPEQQDFMDDAHDYGLVDGISFPLHGPNNTLFVVSFASGDVFRGRAVAPFRNLAGCFHLGALEILDIGGEDLVKQLTGRQIDILKLYADDMNYSEIAEKLKISTGTISNEIYEIRRTLQVDSTRMALVAAFQRGVIGRIRSIS